jgi:amino acid adenylation domain-containing protein
MLGGGSTTTMDLPASQPRHTNGDWYMVVPADRGRVLSFSQERLWFLCNLHPSLAAYSSGVALRIDGGLREDLMQAAFAAVLARHDVLRSRFVPQEDGCHIALSPLSKAPLKLWDREDDAQYLSETEALRLVREESRRPFDLANGPTVRARLIPIGQEQSILSVLMHRLVGDERSVRLFLRELMLTYEALVAGRKPDLPPSQIQYADFAREQRERYEAGESADALAYWRNLLGDEPPVLDLPLDRTRPSTMSYAGGTVTCDIPRETADALADFCAAEGREPGAVLLAAFMTLLSRYSGQDDLVVGIRTSLRKAGVSDTMIGPCENGVPVRVKLFDNPSFLDFSARVQDDANVSLSYAQFPFEKLIEQIDPHRDMSHPPLFRAEFSYEAEHSLPERCATLDLANLDMPPAACEVDLSLHCWQAPQGLQCRLEYATDLFDHHTAVNMLRQMQTLLDEGIACQQKSVSELRLLGDAEQAHILSGFNKTHTDYPREASIPVVFEEIVARFPDRIAVICAGVTLTYAELSKRANTLASELHALGVRRDVLVGLYTERSLEMIVALLGILKAGGAYLPLDVDYPEPRLRFMLDDARVPVVVTHEAVADRLPAGSHAHVVVVDVDTGRMRTGEGCLPTLPGPRDLAYVMYTSGSTGQPKGVCVEHRNVLRLVCNTDYADFGPDTIFLQFAPISFDASTFEIWGALLHGAELVICPPGALSLEQLGRVIVEERITTLWLTAGLFHQIVETQLDDLRGVRQLLAGGDVLSRTHVRLVLEGLPQTLLINGYGPTECTTFTCCHPVRNMDQLGATVPVGRPIANTTVYILDELGCPTPVGVPGELYVGGDGVAREYLRRPALTEERFLPDPFSQESGARMYRTGDRARFLENGTVEFLGRLDNQVKVRGFRIELGEIETTLMNHDAVKEAVVTVWEDAASEKRLAAYVTPRRDESPDAASLKEYLSERLPAYMVPASIHWLEALPLSANGKIDRASLPELSCSQQREYLPPATESESKLAEIWAGLLSVGPVGRDEDFFDLGGHSLLAMRVLNNVRDAFGVSVPLQAVFECPTLAGLSRRIDEVRAVGKSAALPPIRPVSRDRTLPLSYSQEQLWFLDQMSPELTAYNIPLVLRLCGTLNTAAMQLALADIVERHEALRTTFSSEQGIPHQVIHRSFTVPLPVVDLSGQSEAGEDLAEERIQTHFRSLARTVFDLEKGPLLKAELLRIGATEHVLCVVLHHIIFDGWSIGPFLRDLAEAYSACCQARKPDFVPLRVQGADFAVWQREGFAQERFHAAIEFWRQTLADAPPALDLPTDRPLPVSRGSAGAVTTAEVPVAVVDALRALGRAEGATLYATLLALWQLLLKRYSGQSDVLTGSGMAGRDWADIEPVVNFFVNTVVVRTQVDEEVTVREAVREMHVDVMAIQEHQHASLEKIVEAVHPERDAKRGPLFQVMFMLQNTPSVEVFFEGLEANLEYLHNRGAKFDLLLEAEEHDSCLDLRLEYSTELFEESTARRMLEHYTRLLAEAVERPDGRLAELNMLSAGERHQSLAAFDDGAARHSRCEIFRDITRGGAVHERIAQRAQAAPDSVALVHGGVSVTYEAFNARVNRLAHYLRSRGVGPGDIVAVHCGRTPDAIVSIVAALKAGAAYLPMDPLHPEARLAHMLSDSGAKVLLTSGELGDGLHSAGAEVIHLGGLSDDLDRCNAAEPGVPADPRRPIYVIYTSGSTGQAKGTVIRHDGFENLVSWYLDTLELTPDDTFLLVTSLTFDLTQKNIFSPLVSGGTLCLPAGKEFDPVPIAREIESTGTTVINCTPTHAYSLVDLVTDEQLDCLDSLRHLVLAGEPLDISRLRRWWERDSFHTQLMNYYGPTECTDAVSYFPIVAPRSFAGRPVPIGRSLPNVSMYVLDEEDRPVTIGGKGELCVAGVCVCEGYLNRPELTAERFVRLDLPGADGGLVYRTGDLCRVDIDGAVFYLGRLDQQIKIRGYRIELGEIEAALRSQPGVRDAAAAAHTIDTNDVRIAAYVIPSDPANPPQDRILRDELRKALPVYMMPAAIAFLESFPISLHGKLDRKRLPLPDWKRVVGGRAFVAPETAAEEALVRIWRGLLGVEQVGRSDDFFDLGGHSLLATRLAAHIENVFGVSLPLRKVFEKPTVAALAEAIEESLIEELEQMSEQEVASHMDELGGQ